MEQIATRGFPVPIERAEKALRQAAERLGFQVDPGAKFLTVRRGPITVLIRPIESTYIVAEAVLSRGRGLRSLLAGIKGRRDVAPVWEILEQAAGHDRNRRRK